MFSKLKQWNLLALYEKEEDWRMARIQLNIITFNCLLSLLVLFINQIIWHDEPLTIILILGNILHLILFVLVIKKHVFASSLVLTSAYVLMVSSIATIGGGLHDYVVIMYPVIIMYAGLTGQKRGLIFATLLSFAGLSWLVFGEILGWFVITVSHVADQTDLLVSLILITLAAWMVYLLISNMEYGLTQTWRELAERKRIEKLLGEANEQLRADMEKIEQLREELREQAIHDPLTGLYNRRYLNETLTREISRAERENAPLSMIISDIDQFKMINDTYGHLIGDKFLVEIANLMKNHACGSDIICRYGGEEFLMVLPDTTLISATKRAEEIMKKCAKIIIQHEGKDLQVTISSGVASYSNHGKEAEEIIIKADEALYRAKSQGRNCTVIFE